MVRSDEAMHATGARRKNAPVFTRCCSDAGELHLSARSHGEFSTNINSIAGHTADILFFLSYRFRG